MRPEIIKAADLLRRGKVEKALPLLQSTVFSFSMKVCGHREDAEDTMQDVLLKSIQHLGKIEEPRALAVWLYTVTRNRCWMSRRRSKFAPKHHLSLEELMPDGEELASLTKHDQQTPEHEAISKQEAERIHQAVLRIPAQYRLILVLHDMEDLDTGEVAKITGIREGTVRVRLHRARLFVRRELSSPSKTHSKSGNSKRRTPKPIECKRLFAGLSEYIDKRVDNLSCERIEKHLADCPPCIAFVNDLTRAVERCRSLEVGCDSKVAETVHKLLVQEFARLTESQPS